MQSVHETSAGVIVYLRRADGVAEYLLLQSTRGSWEFPKGHVEPGETPQQAATRELHEEAGVEIDGLIPGFARSIQYHFKDRHGRLVTKTVHFFLARVDAIVARLSEEHRDSAVLPFDRAHQQLTHAPSRGLLRDADAFIAANA